MRQVELTKAFATDRYIRNMKRDRKSEITNAFQSMQGGDYRFQQSNYVSILQEILDKGYRIVIAYDPSERADYNGEVHVSISVHSPAGESRQASYRDWYGIEMLEALPEFNPNKQGDKKMKKAKQLGTGAVAANKTAFGMAAQLQGGRVSNKAVKEAVRPLVKLVFKPSFMQKLLAKLFQRENPIDQFLDSPYGSLFAANLAQVALDIKGVEEDSKARVVVIGGIAHAYNELGNLIPVEKTIDEVVKKLTEAASKVVD